MTTVSPQIASAIASPTARVAIIGSGYGGAVAALRLAQKGIAVDLIEMGQDWDKTAPVGQVFSPMNNPDKRSMWFETKTDMPFMYLSGLNWINRTVPYYAGVLGLERFAAMKVYRGVGLGGGSLVNGGMAVTPRQSFIQQIMPQINVAELYSKYFPMANTNLGVAQPAADMVANSTYYKFSRVAADQNTKAGYPTVTVPNVYDWDYMRLESFNRVPKSALASEVIFGNNYGKKSLTKTYLKAALATGKVTVKSLTEVTRILPSGTGYVLTLKKIDTAGAVLSTTDVLYSKVVMAAGSIGTSKMLVKAKAVGDLPNLNAAVGKKWGPNGNTMVARKLAGTNSATGTVQSGIPAQGLMAWDDSTSSVFAEIAPFPVGLETNTANYLALTNNPNFGEFTYNAVTGKVDLNWDAAKHAPSIAATKVVMDKLNAANGGTVRTDMLEGGKAYSDFFTYHPLGGCIIGEATDLNGELLGAPNIFVVDGSLIPAKVGVNPFVTITALAERNMDKLITAGRFA